MSSVISASPDQIKPQIRRRLYLGGLAALLIASLATLAFSVVWDDPQPRQEQQHDTGSAPATDHAVLASLSPTSSDPVRLINERLEQEWSAGLHGHGHWDISTWYPSLTSIEIVENELRIQTSLEAQTISPDRGSDICQTVANLTYLDRVNGTAQFEWIVVRDVTGKMLYRETVLGCL